MSLRDTALHQHLLFYKTCLLLSSMSLSFLHDETGSNEAIRSCVSKRVALGYELWFLLNH